MHFLSCPFRFFGLFAILWLGLFTAVAQPTPAPESGSETYSEALPEKVQALLDSLRYQTGSITLPGEEATLHLPAEFRYLSPADTARVLTDLWGNPPGSETLGMILPAEGTPAQADSWAVIITNEKSGYVKDDDAAKIDYSDLLKKMKKETRENNPARAKAGYPPITLVGWAEPPYYDPQTNKMYWAKELAFENSPEHTLNYDIRILGRRGVLSLNCVASMNQLGQIREQAPGIIRMVDYNSGHRYADFNASTDKVAKYGLAALVAGGVAAKAGLFKGLLVGLLAAKKFVIIGAVALFGFIKKLLGRNKD